MLFATEGTEDTEKILNSFLSFPRRRESRIFRIILDARFHGHDEPLHMIFVLNVKISQPRSLL